MMSSWIYIKSYFLISNRHAQIVNVKSFRNSSVQKLRIIPRFCIVTRSCVILRKYLRSKIKEVGSFFIRCSNINLISLNKYKIKIKNKMCLGDLSLSLGRI